MEEQFNIGDKVFLTHLQETGNVTRLNGADMVFVQVDDMEIPVYCSDITKKIPSTQEAEIELGFAYSGQTHTLFFHMSPP